MDYLIKQRLVGAIVLVALGVIFIPMLLEGPEQPVVPPVSEMPEPESLPPVSELHEFPPPAEIPARPPVAVLEPEQERQQDVAPAAEEKPVASGPVSEAPPATKPQAQPAPAGGEESGPLRKVLRGWVVQVGSFSRRDNALALRDRLRKAGFATQVEKVTLAKGTTYRVRVGPYLQRGEADKAQAKLKKKFVESARVLAYP